MPSTSGQPYNNIILSGKRDSKLANTVFIKMARLCARFDLCSKRTGTEPFFPYTTKPSGIHSGRFGWFGDVFLRLRGSSSLQIKTTEKKLPFFPLNGGGKSLKMITQSKIRINYHEFNSFNRVFNIIGMWISVKCGGLRGKTDSPHRNSVKKLLNTAAHSSCRIPERTMGVWLKGITKRSATEPAQPALGSFAP